MSMNESIMRDDLRERVMFIGNTLGPFFLEDPRKGNIQEAFNAIAALDPNEAAEEWPFVEVATVQPLLQQMREGAASGSDAEELMWEYRRLFVGPAVKPAPPWGSVYTDRECVVFGRSTLALRAWLREKGIERLGDERSPEDHIGLLLLLMAWIADNKPELLGEYLRLHVLTWSSHFLEQLVEIAQHPFYQGLAGLTKESLEGIQDELKLEVEYPRYYR